MSQLPSRSTIAAAGVAALLLLAGSFSVASVAGEPTDLASTADGVASPDPRVTTPTPDDNETDPPDSAAELQSRIESRLSSLASLTATRTRTSTLDGNTTSTTTSHVWYRFTTGEYRIETVAPEDRARTTVAGTDTIWFYQPDADRVTTYNRTGDAVPAMATVGFSSLNLTEYERVTREGEEVYRAKFAPEDERQIDRSMTAWVDVETYFPAAIERTYRGEEFSFTMHVEYDDVTLNASIPDRRFDFDPPENATTDDPGPDIETFESRDAMREAVDLSLPDPEVPGNFTFERGNAIESDQRSLTLAYENESSMLLVSKTDREVSLASIQDTENVTVNGHDGVVRTSDEQTMVAWTCNGSTYAVTGPLDRAALFDVARSMECA